MTFPGVVVLLEPPIVDDLNNTLPGTDEFPYNITPSDARQCSDPTTIGMTFTASDDKAVIRYGIIYSY